MQTKNTVVTMLIPTPADVIADTHVTLFPAHTLVTSIRAVNDAITKFSNPQYNVRMEKATKALVVGVS